jgi:PAS domain-containing protein
VEGQVAEADEGPLRHKSILIAVRLVFAGLVAALALPALGEGGLPVVVLIIFMAYLATGVAMIWESRRVLLGQRIQGFMLLFDLTVLALAMIFLSHDREELFLAMFLVILLASAGQKLSTSLGGFVVIAAFYTWLNLRSPEPDALLHLTVALPVLLVVTIYVGYVSEGVAREREQRLDVQGRLRQELRGMNRIQTLASHGLSDMDSGRLFEGIATTATELLGAPISGVFWTSRDSSRIEAATAPGFPESLLARLKDRSPAQAPFSRVFGASGLHILAGRDLDSLDLPSPRPAELILAPIEDRVGGIEGCLLLGWPPPHRHLAAEEEAARLLVEQAGLLLENSTLYRMLSQARDVWQASFQSIPSPVVIVDGAAKIIQVNPAFLQLGEFDFVNLIGSSFADLLAGSTFPNGRAAMTDQEPIPLFDAARLHIPKLNGDFDVTRGPFFGTPGSGSGTVWVLQRLSAEPTEAGAPTSSPRP